jgi:hypothetical protein
MIEQRLGRDIAHVLFAGLVIMATTLPPAFAQTQPRHSQFISDLPELRENPNYRGSFRWEKIDHALQPYTRFLIDPIQYFIAPDSPYKGVTVKELAVIGGTLQNKIIQALTPNYAVVTSRAPGVARIRFAITNIKFRRKKGEPVVPGLLGYLPATFVLNTVVKEVESSTVLTEARIEVIVEDSVSGERLAVGIDTRFAMKRASGKHSWDAVTADFDHYAKRVRNYIDEDHR